MKVADMTAQHYLNFSWVPLVLKGHIVFLGFKKMLQKVMMLLIFLHFEPLEVCGLNPPHMTHPFKPVGASSHLNNSFEVKCVWEIERKSQENFRWIGMRGTHYTIKHRCQLSDLSAMGKSGFVGDNNIHFHVVKLPPPQGTPALDWMLRNAALGLLWTSQISLVIYCHLIICTVTLGPILIKTPPVSSWVGVNGT